MAKVNFRHNKRQKELVRKERQAERLSRRSERPPREEPLAASVSTDPVPVSPGPEADLQAGQPGE
jgi:DNA repair photolyase